MPSLDPRTPVIVGAGQVSRRPTGPGDLADALSLMVEAGREAATDAGSSGLLDRVQSVRTVESLGWRPESPPAAVADELGIDAKDLVVTATGGNGPLSLLHDTCAAIGRGDLDVALLTGAEAFYSRRVAKAHDVRVPEPASPPDRPARVFGDSASGLHAAELEAGLALPTQIYPLFSNALARSAGDGHQAQRQREGQLWSRFSEVAAANPFAWSPTAFSPEEITEAGADNRMIAFPYTKRCCANIQVDQSAAVIVMSAETASAAGVPRDRWVFPAAGAEAHDHWFVSERDRLDSSPAISECWAALREAGGGVSADDIAFIDLYSCFPSAVQIAAREIGLPTDDPSRPLTLTGGLAFAGGPGNNYSMHSLATAVGRLRGDGGLALVTGVGWFMTKHALTLLSSEPPAGGFAHRSVQDRVDAKPARQAKSGEPATPLTLETFTVLYDREGSPEKSISAGLDGDGARWWVTSGDPDSMAALISDDEVVLS